MNKCKFCGKEVKNKFCDVSCQNRYYGNMSVNKKYGKLKTFKVKCHKCEKEFEVEEREKQFPKKEKYFCSRGCANSRQHSVEVREGLRKTLIKNKESYKQNNIVDSLNLIYECIKCGKQFKSNKRSYKNKFCSKKCTMEYNWELKRETMIKNSSKGGRVSSSVQSETRRSKNEIYFYELCKKHFNKVLSNEPIFNGWDADVIIEDIKVAVLWNGKWHYEKITESHSVEQVQNRDRIKIKEIIDFGYIPYIIKDMGRYNKKFVEEEFNKFLMHAPMV